MSIFAHAYAGVLRTHQAIYERTDGRIGHRLLGVPTLLLRTIGRRTGKDRTNALVYARDGERYLVVPSKGGAPKPPGWFHNLRAAGEAEIQIGRDRQRVRATVIGRDDPEFPRLWTLVNDVNRGTYETYQRRTERMIPSRSRPSTVLIEQRGIRAAELALAPPVSTSLRG